MADHNMVEFYKRAARLERDRAHGLGFEATGTLGRSYYSRRQQIQRRSVLWPAMFLIAVAFVLKGAILYTTGAELYNARVEALRAAPGVVEQVGGWVMQADPVTVQTSRAIAWGVTKART